MRKRWRVIAGLCFTAVLGGGGGLLYTHLHPVPAQLVGVWENETKLVDAGPGEVQLQISATGLVDIHFDRQKYNWWGPDRLHLRVSGNTAQVWVGPKQKVFLRLEVGDGRLTFSYPRSSTRPEDAMVFRRRGQ